MSFEKLKALTNSAQLTEMAKQQKLLPLPTTISVPPTITVGNANSVSTLTNPVIYNAYITDKINPVFLLTGGEYVQKSIYFPKDTFVKNVSKTSSLDEGNIYVEFLHYGQSFEVIESGCIKYRMLIDEGSGYQYVNKIPQDGSISDGNIYLRKVSFGTTNLRKIKLEIYQGGFGGIITNGNDSLSLPSKQLKNAIFLGDSYTEAYSCYGEYACKLLGWDFWNSGVGGTGYLNSNSGAGQVKFRDRVQHDIIRYKPDYLVIAGGINDRAFSVEDIQIESGLLYDTIKTGSPNTKIIVLSDWFPRTPDATSLAIADVLKVESQKRGIPFIDVLRGITYACDGTILTNNVGSWITGIGNVSSIQTTGNASIFIGSDNTHPVEEGHKYLGTKLAFEILKILNN
jgi:acyl-CoA thioesterase-1